MSAIRPDRLRRFVAMLALLVLGAVSMGQESCSDVTKEDAKVKKQGGGGEMSSETAQVGDELSLKGTTYEVTNVDTAPTVGEDQFTKAKANGEFVVVEVALTNEGDEPATILEDNIRLVGGNGKQYSTSDDALLAFDDQTFLLEEIQPDNTEEGTLVYDVPDEAVNGSKLQVEDLFSGSTGEIDLSL